MDIREDFSVLFIFPFWGKNKVLSLEMQVIWAERCVFSPISREIGPSVPVSDEILHPRRHMYARGA